MKVRTPPAPGNSYASDTYARTRTYPLTPHEVDPEAHAPRSHGESSAFWEEAKIRPEVEITNTVHYATADVWDTNLETGKFLVIADVSAGLRAYGPGIYELVIFALVDGEQQIVSEYAFIDDGVW